MTPVSTITPEQILPEAITGVQLFIKRTNTSQLLPQFGSHMSVEDLAMEAVEKVVKANPMYLTKAYVRIAARCVCIDHLTKKKPMFVSVSNKDKDDDLFDTPLEETIAGDSHDHIGDLESDLMTSLSPEQITLYKELLKGKMYVEIAKDLGLSLRTLERQVQELKWKCEFLLIGVDPDENPHSYLF